VTLHRKRIFNCFARNKITHALLGTANLQRARVKREREPLPAQRGAKGGASENNCAAESTKLLENSQKGIAQKINFDFCYQSTQQIFSQSSPRILLSGEIENKNRAALLYSINALSISLLLSFAEISLKRSIIFT
jgi:hypothetical protein